MFGQQWRAALDAPWTGREFIWVAGKFMPAQIRMSDLHDELTMHGLFIFQECAGRIYRGCSQALGLEILEKRFCLISRCARFDELVEQRPEWKSVLDVFQFRIGKLRGLAEPLDKPPPMVRLIAKNTSVTVLAFISLGDGGRLAVPGAL